MSFFLSPSLKACTNCTLYDLQRNSFFKLFHAVLLRIFNSRRAHKLIFVDCERRSAAHFLSSHLQHKVDPDLAACEIHGQFQLTDFTTLKWSFFGVNVFWYWSWIFSERKWVFAIRETTKNTVRAPHPYTSPRWLAGFLSSSARVECHLAVWVETWEPGATFETYLTKLLLPVQKLWQQIFV